MKRMILTVAMFIVACFAMPQCFAQKNALEPIAPLLSDKTLAVAHLNLRAVDFDQIEKLLLDGVKEYITIQRFEQESTAEVLAESAKLIAAKRPEIETAFQDFLEETGLRDMYFISYYDLIETMPGFIVIPANDMTVEQYENLQEKTPSTLHHIGGLLVLPLGPSFREVDDNSWSEYFEAIKPVKIPAFDEAFAGTDQALFRVAVVVPENVTRILTEAGMPMIPIPQVGSLLYLLNDHTRWASAVLDLENANIRVAVQMSSKDSASEAREVLIDLIDMQVSMITMQMVEQEEMADFIPLMRDRKSTRLNSSH